MKKYRFLSLLLLFPMVLTLFTAPAAALEEPDLFCTNAVLLDANYNEVLYDKGAYEKAYPASTTKVMTALLVLEAIENGQLSPSTMVTAGPTRMQDIPSGRRLCGGQLEGGRSHVGGGPALLCHAPLRRRRRQCIGGRSRWHHRGFRSPYEPKGRGTGLSEHPFHQHSRHAQRGPLLHSL